MSAHCRGCGVEFPPDGGSGVYGFCLNCRTEYRDTEWGADLARAKDVQAKDVDRLITRTPRKRSRWGRPWERRR